MKFNQKERKLIDYFKRYLEILYKDYINESTIIEFAEMVNLTEDEINILKRRFL